MGDKGALVYLGSPSKSQGQGMVENRIVPVGSTGGDDEDDMQVFIKRNIISIVHPVGEQLRELVSQFQYMQKDISLLDTECHRVRDYLDQHDRELLAAKSGQSQTSIRLDKLQSELEKAQEEKSQLSKDHEQTKASLLNTDNKVHNLTTAMRATKQMHEELEGNLQSVKSSLSKAEKALLGQGRNLAQLRDQHDDLAYRHTSTEKRMDKAHIDGESMSRDLLKHTKLCEYQKKEDAANYQRLDDLVRKLQDMVDEAHSLLARHASDIKMNESGVQQLKQVLDHEHGASKKIEALIGKQSEMHRHLDKHDDRLCKVEGSVEEHASNMVRDRQSQYTLSQEQQEQISKTSFDLAAMEKAHQRHGQEIGSFKAVVTCTDKLQRSQAKLQEQVDSLEEELMNLVVVQKAATANIENHAYKHQKFQEDLQQMAKEVDSTVQCLKGEIGSTRSSVLKLGAHYDNCNQSIQRMTNGFQDAHRHIQIAGDPAGMMMPAKRAGSGAGGTALPAIPQTPRSTVK